MAWTAEDRRRYAPAIQEMVRAGMIVRLARQGHAVPVHGNETRLCA